MPFRIERVSAADTFPLRRRVLRPHETHDELGSARNDSATVHFAARDAGIVVGSGAVAREAPPWAADSVASWRLRGMATADDRRNEGVGAAVLDAVIDFVRSNGGGLLWCNARTPAQVFYERAGFTTRGDSWVDPVIGPHVAMELYVEARADQARRDE